MNSLYPTQSKYPLCYGEYKYIEDIQLENWIEIIKNYNINDNIGYFILVDIHIPTECY